MVIFAICNFFWFIASNSSRDKCLITYLLRISEPASRSQLKHWSPLKEKHWNYQWTMKNLFSDSKLKKDFNWYPGKLETKKGNLPADTFQIYYKKLNYWIVKDNTTVVWLLIESTDWKSESIGLQVELCMSTCTHTLFLISSHKNPFLGIRF